MVTYFHGNLEDIKCYTEADLGNMRHGEWANMAAGEPGDRQSLSSREEQMSLEKQASSTLTAYYALVQPSCMTGL